MRFKILEWVCVVGEGWRERGRRNCTERYTLTTRMI